MASSTKIIPFTRNSSRKLDFRILSNIFNIVIFGLIGASATVTLGRWDGAYIFSFVGIAAPAFSVVWTTAAIILQLRYRLQPRYHPAIDLSFDIFSWLLYWIFGGFILADVSASEGLIQCSPFYDGVPNRSWCERNQGTKKWNLDTAIGSFFVLNGLIHLVFFAIACQQVKDYRRNTWGKNRESYELNRN